MKPAAAGASIALVLGGGACTPAPDAPSTWHSPDSHAWAALRSELRDERAQRPTRPWAAEVRVAVHEPRMGRDVTGRGAIAVAPGRAMRMILVGAAGATMLDAWVQRDRWRVAVPATGLVRRGGSDEPRDLPVGFLRWWLLSPLEGSLVAAEQTAEGPRWLLRDGGAVVDLRAVPCDDGASGLAASRSVAGRTERVAECGAAPEPRPGDRVEYEDAASGLRISIVVESAVRTPSDDAFRDPDLPEQGS
jgi:hypothetical protein